MTIVNRIIYVTLTTKYICIDVYIDNNERLILRTRNYPIH